ncbi:MAG: O-antigen ligase family protein [Patescibacteria group bacterium]|jgi:putative inorganic carbon (HCO3(-)) transporter
MIKEQKYKKILQGLFFLALLSPLVVDQRLFFPYVTTSALYFQLITEVLFFLWVIFILLYPKQRPKFSLLAKIFSLYILTLILATIFSVNQYLSFWGDTERMMGLFSILHFFALFLVGISLFRNKKELKLLLTVFVGISSFLCIYGILQWFGLTNIKPGVNRIMATVGNSGVFAGYLIFGLFFSSYLAMSSSEKNWKIAYYAGVLLHLIAIFLTGTRGAYLGAAAGIFICLAVLLKNLKLNKKLRRGAIISVVLIAVLYGLLFINKDNEWIKSKGFDRATQFSLQESTAITRFMSWKWGLEGFKEKPILGYGLNQFAVPYNKYLEPDYYNYAPGDNYFDRAHNIIIELLSTTGLVGSAAYLLLLIAIFYSIIKYYRTEKDRVYLGAMGGLIIAYFIQNLFIFDMLPQILGLMVFLIFINNSPQAEAVYESDKKGAPKILVVLIALILLGGLSYSYKKIIFNEYWALRDNVAGQVLMPTNHEQGMAYLQRSLSYGTPLDLDLRSSVANTIFNYYLQSGSQRPEKKDDINYAINLYKENLKYLPNDTYYNYKTGELLNYRFDVESTSENILHEETLKEAMEYINRSIETSPNRIESYFLVSQNLLMDGELEKAVENAEKAVSLNDRWSKSYWELAKVYYLTNKYSEARESLIKAIDLGERINEKTLTNFVGLFDVQNDVNEEIIFYELMIKNGTSNYLYYSTLANKYYEQGQWDKAVQYARQAVNLNPEIKDSVEKFVQNAEEKKQAEAE